MVRLGDGITDLLSTLLSHSDDEGTGKHINWNVKAENGNIDITSEYTDENSGDKRFYTLDLSQAMAVVRVRKEVKAEKDAEKKAKEDAAFVAKNATDKETKAEAKKVAGIGK